MTIIAYCTNVYILNRLIINRISLIEEHHITHMRKYNDMTELKRNDFISPMQEYFIYDAAQTANRTQTFWDFVKGGRIFSQEKRRQAAAACRQGSRYSLKT